MNDHENNESVETLTEEELETVTGGARPLLEVSRINFDGEVFSTPPN